MSMTAADILGPDGRIAARLSNYEHRPQQLEMADAVARAIAARRHLLVEAGTGVGKSFAYLVPAILAAAASQNRPTGTAPDTSAGAAPDTEPGAERTPRQAGGPSAAGALGALGEALGSDDRQEEDDTPGSDAADGDRGPRIVVATHTISLQEQLIHKDLPFLNAVIPLEFSAVLVKGRGNYL